MSKTTMTDEEFEEMFCRMMAESPKRSVPEDSEDSPEKVKVPAVFDKWYKQVEKASDGYNVENRAMNLIASHGFGYGVADKDNVLGLNFEFTEEEVCRMREYVDRNKKDAMHAVLDGYEVEKEQLYTIDLPHIGDCLMRIQYNTGEDNFTLGNKVNVPWRSRDTFLFVDQFPMNVIEERLPEYKKYAVAV